MSLAGWTLKNRQSAFAWSTGEGADQYLTQPSTFEHWSVTAVEALSKSGISLPEAWKRGIRYVAGVREKTLLKGEFGSKRIPTVSADGLIIPHFDLAGVRSMQYRPDRPYTVATASEKKPRPRKYDWGRGSGSGVSIGYNAALRLEAGTVQRLVIVEGTKQAIACDIYAPEGDAVVGIQGIWNGQKEGELLDDLAVLARRGYDIIVVPDGDVATKKHVHDGATLLHELLYDAACADIIEAMEGADFDTLQNLMRASLARAPKVVTLPTAEGIDDILGATTEDERAALLSELLDSADELPDRPHDDDDGSSETREVTRWDRLNSALPATVFLEAVYGGEDLGGRFELPEGTLTIGRLGRQRVEFVKPQTAAVAARLGIKEGKVATTSTLLIGALGGKAAWGVLARFDGNPGALVAWLEENGDDLAAGAAALLPSKRAERRVHAEITRAFDSLFTLADLGAGSEFVSPSHAARAFAQRKGLDVWEVMEELIEQRVEIGRLSTRGVGEGGEVPNQPKDHK